MQIWSAHWYLVNKKEGLLFVLSNTWVDRALLDVPGQLSRGNCVSQVDQAAGRILKKAVWYGRTVGRFVNILFINLFSVLIIDG